MTKRNGKDRTVNAGYANWQLAKALASAQRADDPATLGRAQKRAEKWRRIFESIVDGTVDFGSRTPLPDIPAWATPEVVTGGFVTGELLAGGPLQPHEVELAQRAELQPEEDAGRRALNLWHLTEEGFSTLADALETGNYEIRVPEEGALLTVALLLARDEQESAPQLLDEIGGYFDRLRFYPAPSASSSPDGAEVFRWSVEKVAASIAARTPNDNVNAQREAVEVWAPLLDRMVELLLPFSNEHEPLPDPQSDFAKQANTLLSDIDAAESAYRRCTKPHKRKANFSQLRYLLRRHLDSGLSDRELNRLRELLRRCVAKRGVPGSDKHAAIRATQQEQISAPSYYELSRIVVKRLEALPGNGGLDDVAPILRPVSGQESSREVPTRADIPAPIVRKVRRCERNSAGKLVDAGIIPSADTLAEVLPQITSGIRSMGMPDAAMRRLYSSIYRAFRRRRSLLLLNLEHQVNIEELPWVAAMENCRVDDLNAIASSRQALAEVSLITITAFPQAIVPNKMLQELTALAAGAELNLPIVEELAADIFMGRFTAKFVRAAKTAADLLHGTLYAVYYDIDFEAVSNLSEVPAKRGLFRGGSRDEFAELVCERAGVRDGGWDIAANGMLIEQQQILTTQNLAVLTAGLDLRRELSARAHGLAKTCFRWVCRRLQASVQRHHDHLIALKNSAYAWRQMIFFVSLLDAADQRAYVAWAEGELNRQRTDFSLRFLPAVAGLRNALDHGIAPPRVPDENGVQFLGWAKEKHWLVPQSK